MNIKGIVSIMAIMGAVSMLLNGCGKKAANESLVNTPFYIKAGMSPAEYNQRNQEYINKNINKQPAGLNFYDQDWSSKTPGTVQVDHGDYSFSVPYVLGTMGTEHTKNLDQGIYQFSIRSGLTPDETIDHEQARIEMMVLLQEIVAKGWQPFIGQNKPRLSGKESFSYRVEDNDLYTPDPLYIPTFDEWMGLDTDSDWAFHIDNVFLTVNIRRRLSHKGNDALGVYLLTFTLITHEEKARNSFDGKDREQWQSLWAEAAKTSKVSRYKKEVELIKRGYHINTDYIDPIIHADDPVEPDSDEALALLNYINENNN